MDNLHLFWAELSDEIERAKRRISATDKGCWFRGHRDGNWKLIPRLLRYPNGIAREETLQIEFQNRGAEQLQNVGNDWEMLVRMQHFGVPTRLLDWSDRLSTALYFALLGEAKKPCLWVLNPFLLSVKATSGRFKAILDFQDDPEFAYPKLLLRQNAWPYRLPIPMTSPWKFKRIGQQGGFFTVHGTDLEPLEALAPRFVTHVSIPDELVDYGRRHLLQNGIDDFDIFNDLDSLGRAISKKYGMHP